MEERKFKEHEGFDEKDFEKEPFSESNFSPMKTGSGRLKTSSSRQEGVKQEASSKYKQQARRRMQSESRSDASASDPKATLNANSSYPGSRAVGKARPSPIAWPRSPIRAMMIATPASRLSLKPKVESQGQGFAPTPCTASNQLEPNRLPQRRPNSLRPPRQPKRRPQTAQRR